MRNICVCCGWGRGRGGGGCWRLALVTVSGTIRVTTLSEQIRVDDSRVIGCDSEVPKISMEDEIEVCGFS